MILEIEPSKPLEYRSRGKEGKSLYKLFFAGKIAKPLVFHRHKGLHL